MSKELVIQLMKKKFKIKIVSIKLGDGLSNIGYKLMDSKGRKYFFKILSEEQPFKLLEKHANFITNFKDNVIFEDDFYRIENFIENQPINRELLKKEPYIFL